MGVAFQAWRGMLEELDNTGKAVRHNADSLEKETLDKLNSLYAEKRKARKHYQEEHSRIAQQFTNVSTYHLPNRQPLTSDL